MRRQDEKGTAGERERERVFDNSIFTFPASPSLLLGPNFWEKKAPQVSPLCRSAGQLIVQVASNAENII